MAASPERPDTIGVDELRTLETAVLKTLCLTINTAGSELKYKILDSLSDDDFYFPVLRALFSTLSDMHRRGDYVISANLEEELQKGAVDVPAGFSVEQLFDGTLPSLAELSASVARLKERSRSGMVPTVTPRVPERVAPPPAPKADATVVKPLDEVKKRIADEARKSNPVLPEPGSASKAVVTPPPSSPGVGRHEVFPSAPAEKPASPAVTPLPRAKAPPTPPPRERSAPVVSSSPGTTGSKGPKKALLSSEGEEWSNYLEDLVAQPAIRFDTGFGALDARLGGLSPGLMVLIDEDRDRVESFLKQLTDQVAAGTSMRCLFLAAELPKSALRLRTISRLAAVPVSDLEKGRLRKDSPEHRRVDGAGREAQEWLRRVFVYEVEGEIESSLVRELVKKLLESSEQGTCLVVLDTLERISGPPGAGNSPVTQLKSLAQSLDVLIVAAATDPTLLASKDADYAAVFRNTPQGQVELEVLQAGKETSTVIGFRYEPEFCRFTET